MPFRINNPGGGDCGFYAFAIGLINAIQEEYALENKSKIFDQWKSKGLNNVSLQEILDIDLYKLHDSPYSYKKEVLLKLQMSLRGIAAKAYKNDLLSKIAAEIKEGEGTKVECSRVYHKFMELVYYFLGESNTDEGIRDLDEISKFNELAFSSEVLILAKKTAGSLKPTRNKPFKEKQKIENEYVKKVFLQDVMSDDKENPRSVILKGIEKIKERGRWAIHDDLKEVADQLMVNLYVANQINGELIEGWFTIFLNNERNAHWTTNIENYGDEVKFSEIKKREFFGRLSKIFSDPNQIDKAVLEKKIATIKSTFGTPKFASLRELDAYGVFNSDGSINKVVAAKYGITFDESRITERLKSFQFGQLSVREMIVFESVIDAVEKEYPHLPSNRLAKACFADFWPPRNFKLLTNPLSMELTGPAQQMIGGGYFKFKETNISISPGPSSARSLTPTENPEHYEAQKDIAGYLENLLKNNVAHVFAMGRVFPYYPQDGFDQRLIRKDQIIDDFINYFIPDANGCVRLPEIPELKDIHITSRPIQKVGRFITYEISINGSAPIQVHHFPIRDKQPLELTPEELAHIKGVAQTTPPEQNIHTHCRGGKGRSAQVAYLLASLNPKYNQLSHEQRLAQMRAEKTPYDEPKQFIETPFQKDYIEVAGYQIHDSVVSLKDEDSEIYFIYGTLLKQEIEKHLRQIDLPLNKLETEKQRALLELMEKYQELSSIPPDELPKWVKEVCENPLITMSTKTFFESIENSTDFLVNAFKEKRNLDELELFFHIQSRHGSYQDILAQLVSAYLKFSIEIEERKEKKDSEQAKIEQDKLEKYAASFVDHVQDAYLKNWEKVSEEDKVACKFDISKQINRILDALIHNDPKTFTKAEFENFKKEYYQCKQRLELLEKAERNDDKVVDDELKQRSKDVEQLFLLGYDHIAVNTNDIIAKMRLIYQRLNELIATDDLGSEQWDALKKEFTALKTVFDFRKPDEMETPYGVSFLDKLFQGNITNLSTLFIQEVLQVKSKKESLDEFVAGLGFAVLDTAVEALPKEYYGDNGVYSKKINLLIDDIAELAEIYKKPNEKGVINLNLIQNREIPTQKEYEEAREQVIDLISKHLPSLRVEKIEAQIKKVDEVDEEESLLTKQYRESRENVLRIQAIRSGAAREAQDEIPFFESRIEKKKQKELGYPNPPKLIVFPVDEILLDWGNDEVNRVQKLINVLNYAKDHGIEVALTSHQTQFLDDEQSSISQLKTKIEKEAEINISPMLTFLDALTLHHEKATTVKYFQNKTAQLQKEIELLKNQLPTTENEEELERTIATLQSELDSLPEKLFKLTSDEFIHLDAVRHLHALKKASNNNDYYQMVEGGILKDFKNPELSKDLGISELEREKIWNDLFKLAEVFMDAEYEYPELPPITKSSPTAKPSLQTILKDLIFNADKPELLQKKYGDSRQWEEARLNIQENKEYFLQHIPQIESFYQSRLAYQKGRFEKRISEKAVLNEEDVVVFDSQQNSIDLIHQHSNYRTIKVHENSSQDRVELNYEMGAYNDVIAYLEGKKVPPGYGPKSINKTLEPYLKLIPDFRTYEFQHSPIVLHAEMSKILLKLPELSTEEEVQKRYKEQFLEAAIERYHQLPKALQDDFVKTYYRDAHQTLESINQKLKELISSPSPKLSEELTKLKIKADKIIEMDEKFSQHISPTFLSSEAKLLRLMIDESLLSENLESLQLEDDKVKFKQDHDEVRTYFYKESLGLELEVYQQKIHPALEEMDVFNKEFTAEQYERFISKHLKEIIDFYIRENDPSSTLNAQVKERKVPSLKSLLEILQNDVNDVIKMDPDKNKASVKVHCQLSAAEKLCQVLLQFVPYQNRADDLKGQTVEYVKQISDLSKEIKDYKSKIESSEEYKAKLFLDKAEKYLLTKNWNVGFQFLWNKHTERVNGKDKKIPETVAQQLAVIREARENDKYLEAKEKFLTIGKQKEISWRSSKVARNYYSLFKKKEEILEKDLNKEFSLTK